jgi:uncharacterized protein YjbI with pentapeptide repeats
MTPGNEQDRSAEPPSQPAGTPDLERASLEQASLDHASPEHAELRNEALQSAPVQSAPVQSAQIQTGPLQSAPVQSAPSGGAEVPARRSWQGRLLGISFAIFAFEIGLFLVIFPWMGDAWDLNYIQSMGPVLQNIWDEPYFRGAVSGLGFLNIYIAMLQIARLFRRSS